MIPMHVGRVKPAVPIGSVPGVGDGLTGGGRRACAGLRGGRAEMAADMARQGIPAAMQGDVFTMSLAILVGATLIGAALHGAAFHGLRRSRRWGWIAAVIVAALWSLLIVGIPVLVRLVGRDVRRAFGVD